MMTILQPLRNRCLIFPVVLLMGFAFAQNAVDRIGQIAEALQSKEFGRALELVRPALQASPGNAQLWTMQGVAYAGQGQKKEALTSFQSALKISPDYLPALHGAIQIEFENGSPTAIPLLQRVLRSHPGDATSHAMLAVLEYQRETAQPLPAILKRPGQ